MKQHKVHIKKGDNVVVISGAAKGEKGTVLKTFPSTGRVIVEGVNVRRKHVRSRKQGEKGQIVMVPASVHASNIKLLEKSSKEEKKETTKENKKDNK